MRNAIHGRDNRAGDARDPAPGSRPRILLRSSWQAVNIGDIGHTPGALRLLEAHLPAADVLLWPNDTSHGVLELLQAEFPEIPLVRTDEEVSEAMRQCDFFLHGSGPSLVAKKDVRRWREETGKPYGVFGITLPAIDEDVRDHLNHAAFVYFRDSVSLEYAKREGVRCPVMAFGPDAAFAVDLRNDGAADAFLAANGLEPGGFLCCIPKYRYTPYWRISDRPFDERRHARNEEMKEHDHAPLRAAIAEVVRKTNMNVLLCPEDETQMAVGKEMLLDRLPPGIRRRVVWRSSYWRTDEAVSTYVRSAGLFGLEMHSPIMCIGNGVPAVVCRFDEQTSKGYMWRDIGLGDWLFDMDSPEDVEKLVPTVLRIATDPAAAVTRAEVAREKVRRLQKSMVEQLAAVLR